MARNTKTVVRIDTDAIDRHQFVESMANLVWAEIKARRDRSDRDPATAAGDVAITEAMETTS